MRDRVRVGLLAFLITLAIGWLPWIAWFAFEVYVLGHSDAKLGRYTYFLAGVLLRGASAAISAAVAAGVYALETMYPVPLSPRPRLYSIVGGAVVLSALSPIVPVLYVLIIGWPELAGHAVPWAFVGLLCTLGAVVAAHWVARHEDMMSSRPTTGCS